MWACNEIKQNKTNVVQRELEQAGSVSTLPFMMTMLLPALQGVFTIILIIITLINDHHHYHNPLPAITTKPKFLVINKLFWHQSDLSKAICGDLIKSGNILPRYISFLLEGIRWSPRNSLLPRSLAQHVPSSWSGHSWPDSSCQSNEKGKWWCNSYIYWQLFQVPMSGDEGRVVPTQLFNYKLEAIIDENSNATSALYHVVMYVFTRKILAGSLPQRGWRKEKSAVSNAIPIQTLHRCSNQKPGVNNNFSSKHYWHWI